MTTEITYAEVRFKNEAKASGTPSEAPAAPEETSPRPSNSAPEEKTSPPPSNSAPKEKTSPTPSNSRNFKLLLAAVVILLLLTISFFIAFVSFFPKYSKLVQEQKFAQELTHTALECKKANLTMKVKSWSCCPKNWEPFGSSCYFISSETKNWTDSEKNCERMQAHLLVVDSKEEQDFVKNLLISGSYYLGLSDLKNGHWEWVNETPYNQSATFWHPGEPSNGNEHCVVLRFNSFWGWNDISCYLPQNSICEMLKIYF